MPSSIIAKYFPKDLLEDQISPLAISDKNQKLVWFNKSFKDIMGPGRLKGVSISALFDIPDEKLAKILSGKKTQLENILQKENDLIITPLPLRGKPKSLQGYLLEIFPRVKNEIESEAHWRIHGGNDPGGDNSRVGLRHGRGDDVLRGYNRFGDFPFGKHC